MKACQDCIHRLACDDANAEDCVFFANINDYQKVVHAKWTNGCFYPTYEPEENKKNGLQTAYCTNCHVTQTVNTHNGTVQFNFCPYCGAKMDLE